MTWVRFSLDSVDPASYSAMKGVNPNALKQVLHNIERLSTCTRRPRVVVNVNLSRWNSPHVIDTLLKSRELGVDGFQIRPILPRVGEMYTRDDIQFYIDWIRKLPELQQYQTKDFQIFVSYDKFRDVVEGKLNVRDYDRCQYHQFIVVLDSSGDLCVCTHHMGDDRFTFGNIYDNTVKEIWGSDKRQAAIDHCNHMDFKDCQACCKGHEINKFIHFIQNPIKKSDPDFF
jgi:radical SAM protein with 4Fe4S-binding SPASM domain